MALQTDSMKRHLVGIGGVGMSALATALLRQGYTVTGADRSLDTPNIRFLKSIGIEIFPDDGSGIDEETAEVIVSTAIEESNMAIRRARELQIPIVHRARALSRALSHKRLVAVAGTCGKSTVTAMLGHILTQCGLDPFCVNGANVPGWEGAVRFGVGEYAVAEVDESDKSLVEFSPYAAIITNASADHFSKEEMDSVFDDLASKCSGPVIDGRNDLTSQSQLDEVETSMPGKHNRQNASLALKMALALGCDEETARAALKTFGGVERRLQRVFPKIETSQNKTAIYDDYAHNPEKLCAMWTTLAEHYPEGVCVIWRPHGYAPLRKMLLPLAEMFNKTIRPQDKLLLLPVYDAGGTTDRSINSDNLLAELSALSPCEESSAKAILVNSLDDAFNWCVANKGKFKCFTTCGARDPGLPVLAQKLADALTT